MPEIQAFGWRSKKTMSSRLAWATQDTVSKKKSYKTNKTQIQDMPTSDICVTIEAKRSQRNTPPNCQCEGFPGFHGLFVAFVPHHYKWLEDSRKETFFLASVLNEALLNYKT